jgi:hypothetical protein
MPCPKIPASYKILPSLICLSIPHTNPLKEIWTLAPEPIDSTSWFNDFQSRVESAINSRSHLPILRCSDGEYRFAFGEQPPSLRTPPRDYPRQMAMFFLRRVRGSFQGFKGSTAPGISVGQYTKAELREGRAIFERGMLHTLRFGILAAHLTFADQPFQERFHPAFSRFLHNHGLRLSLKNYVPFYFVYGILNHHWLANLVDGRRILLVHSATGHKQTCITNSLSALNPQKILWKHISPSRSLFETLTLSEEEADSDLVILGGGVGKFGLILSLSTFHGPVIDAGYYFEAWANPANASRRIFCTVAAGGENPTQRLASKIND